MVAPLVYQSNNTAKYNVCLVFHGTDCIPRVLQEIKNIHHLCVNDQHAQDFIDKLVECSSVLSTSFHGMATSHAYGIPGEWSTFYIVENCKQKYFLKLTKSLCFCNQQNVCALVCMTF